MIIGHGLIAHGFQAYTSDPEVIIYASGVANSGETDPTKFLRESDLLKHTLDHIDTATLVYFSTFSILTKQSPYTLHKLAMEQMIASSGKKHLIIRATNLAGPTNNPNTLLNVLTHRLQHQLKIALQYQCQRNILDIEDLCTIVTHILQQQDDSTTLFHVGYPYSYSLPEIITILEEHYQLKANLELVASSEPFLESFYPVKDIPEFELRPKELYLKHLLFKYYPVDRLS